MSRQEMEKFRGYLRESNWFEEGSISDLVCGLRKCIAALEAEGLDLDTCLQTPSGIKEADKAIHGAPESNRMLDLMHHAFAIYCYMENGKWLDSYRPRGFGKASKTASASPRHKVKPVKAPSPAHHPKLGPDRDGTHVHYAKEAAADLRITGLAEHLEAEYERILGAARELNLDDFPPLTRIPVILSPGRPYETRPINDQYKEKLIAKLEKERKQPLSLGEIYDILDADEEAVRTLGEYYDYFNPTKPEEWNCKESPIIYIYYRNIDFADLTTYFAKAAMVLAHEFMHHVHLLSIGAMAFSEGGKQAEQVQEAVADFFSIYYIEFPHPDYNITQRFKLAKDLYEDWLFTRCIDWPYSYALEFFWEDGVLGDYQPIHNQMIAKFRAVTLTSPLEDAHKILLRH